MRLLLLANNWVGWQIASWLAEQNEVIVGVVVHTPDQGRHVEDILASTRLSRPQIFMGNRLREPETVAAIRQLEADLAISAFFGHILTPAFLAMFPHGAINLHPSLLPHNRGSYPNVWSIVDGTPAGVTVHYLDAGIDTGDIIAQRHVPVEAVDTGASLYRKLERECLALFQEAWPQIKQGSIVRRPQDPLAGTSYRMRDVERLDEISLDATYKAQDLLNILRARTFPPHPGAYFIENGRKVYLRLELTYDDSTGGTP